MILWDRGQTDQSHNLMEQILVFGIELIAMPMFSDIISLGKSDKKLKQISKTISS